MDNLPDVGQVYRPENETEEEIHDIEYEINSDFKDMINEIVTRSIKTELHSVKEDISKINNLIKKIHYTVSELVQQSNDNTVSLVSLTKKNLLWDASAFQRILERNDENIRSLIQENNSLRDLVRVLINTGTEKTT